MQRCFIHQKKAGGLCHAAPLQQDRAPPARFFVCSIYINRKPSFFKASKLNSRKKHQQSAPRRNGSAVQKHLADAAVLHAAPAHVCYGHFAFICKDCFAEIDVNHIVQHISSVKRYITAGKTIIKSPAAALDPDHGRRSVSRRPSGLRKTILLYNSLAHITTWLRSDLHQ